MRERAPLPFLAWWDRYGTILETTAVTTAYVLAACTSGTILAVAAATLLTGGGHG
ncbi:hypothetical protein [Streptomyces yaizuensis]|uniref:Uncharacterized protein n=1 Tax=Streptomyces yaizuensis TaxID=2989713 RepID=A0AA86IVB5_9ACTN|nr:hypothetical protein [Streptomyces sp. YSPA8]BDT39464.1 hypothetical protein SYYSPA8_36730 [Streptomyces sp. YSPA8]